VVFVSGNFHFKNNFLKNSTFIEFSAEQKSIHSTAANTKLIHGDGGKLKN
jgi:UDP-2,3-diacylglucosamine pyrophosphatase LpxH